MTPAELPIAAANTLLTAISIVLLIPALVLFIECVAALFPDQRGRVLSPSPRPRVNVLIPAHNEESGISATVNTVLPQLADGDRVIVVADNCQDNTATIARQAGATVIERQDSERRGKGYALDFGVQFMATDPPDVVIIVDADCIVELGSVTELAQLSQQHDRPVQALYLFEVPKPLSAKSAVSTLAITVKNWVRLAGLKNLGLPCLLTGTGMAMPWAVIAAAPLASGNIVEDMNLGMDLAIAGYSPLFCSAARVTSVLPQKEQAAKSQRTRWEHGHMQTMMTQMPRLFQAGIRQGRVDLLALAMDLLVPPLSLLAMFWLLGSSAAALGLWCGGSALPLIILGITGGLILIAILSAWAKYCRRELPAQTLLSIPLYILWKIPLYFAFLFKRQKAWVRTERDIDPQTPSPKP